MAKSVKTKKRKITPKQVPIGGVESNLTTETIPLEESGKPVKGAFSGWPMIIGWAAMLVFTFHACTHMVAAGDTWVAMACGRHFVNHGVDTVEPFSANSHKAGPTAQTMSDYASALRSDALGKSGVKYSLIRWWADKCDNFQNWPAWKQSFAKWIHPTGWIDQNWLTHVLFYKLVPKSTYADGVSFTSNALVYWKFAIYILTVVCVYFTSRILGANRFLAVVFACFAMFIGRSFLDIRPAGFSNMLVAVFLLILALTTYRNSLYIWLILPLTVFWGNVHGGYIYVFIMLVPFFIWHLLLLADKRWTLSGYCILAWMALYGLAYHFSSRVSPDSTSLTKDWFFYVLLILVASTIALATRKKLSVEELNVFHMIVSGIVFLALLPRFFPGLPNTLTTMERDQMLQYISSSRLTFLAIFVFIMFLRYILTHFKETVALSIDRRSMYHIAAAGLAAFVAVIIFNPFHLTNLTHTFVISVSKNAERWRDIHEWHPAFDWDNPVGTAVPFLVMYIIGWLVLIAWSFYLVTVSRLNNDRPKRRSKISDGYHWSKIDFSLLIIASLTVYMAIRSRRFIPIAAITACPIIAMFLTQMIHAVSAKYNLKNGHGLVIPAMPRNVQHVFIAAGALAVILFGTWWGLKFKRVYLDPWPNDPKFSSVFMRMTASDAKPFYAMKFIKDNKLKGKMFNYWTEGGFIAWGQEPDPNTGFTPLQLFMDGRAQAAYNRKTFDEWSYILAGGNTTLQILRTAQLRGETLTRTDYQKIGEFMDKELRARDVWIILMPATVYNDPNPDPFKPSSYYTFRALELDPEWRLVFLNDRQRILVDVGTPQGEKLFNGILTGETKYPDEYHQDLARANTLLVYGPSLDDKGRGLDYAIQAFNLNHAPAAMLEVLSADGFSQLKPAIQKFCEDYADSFDNNIRDWIKQDGYRMKVDAARLANYYAAQVERKQNNIELANIYEAQRDFCDGELGRINVEKRW